MDGGVTNVESVRAVDSTVAGTGRIDKVVERILKDIPQHLGRSERKK